MSEPSSADTSPTKKEKKEKKGKKLIEDKSIIYQGFLVKQGAVRKNWKLRWMVLKKDGSLYYFKKLIQPFKKEAALGTVEIQSHCLGLLEHDEVLSRNLVSWPSNCANGTGFALKMRNGRSFFLFAETKESSQRWLAAIRTVAANVVLEEDQLEKKAGEEAAAPEGDTSDDEDEEDAAYGFGDLTVEDREVEEEAEKVYVHKVVGGMVIKSERKSQS